MAWVEVRRDGAAGVVTLNKPPVNALDAAFLQEIEAAAAQLADDESVRVVVFRSGIPGIFVAGADIKAFQDRAATAAAIEAFHRCFRRIEEMPKPTIAAVSGHALGGGCELTLACDFRLMVDDGRSLIGLPEVNLGLFPGAGGTQRLPRLIGEGRALDIILHGRRLSAAEALAVGLVQQTAPPDEFDALVSEYARRLAAGPTRALAAAKALVRGALSMPLEQGLAAEREAFLAVMESADAQEGVRAFLEKRSPAFEGR